MFETVIVKLIQNEYYYVPSWLNLSDITLYMSASWLVVGRTQSYKVLLMNQMCIHTYMHAYIHTHVCTNTHIIDLNIANMHIR